MPRTDSEFESPGRRHELTAEVQCLAGDPADSAERRAVMAEMEALAPEWPE